MIGQGRRYTIGRGSLPAAAWIQELGRLVRNAGHPLELRKLWIDHASTRAAIVAGEGEEARAKLRTLETEVNDRLSRLRFP